jgi:hypothetical protein
MITIPDISLAANILSILPDYHHWSQGTNTMAQKQIAAGTNFIEVDFYSALLPHMTLP